MDIVLPNLIHNPTCFSRETLEDRMARMGVKNIVRMELFLWDLEIFLQLQKILGDRLVLKGGAAVQFYLPISDQRTSVDIDMLFRGTIEEIQDALSQVEAKFPHNNETFHFVKHNPRQPKTKLPLYTYYLQVPSVCTSKETREGTKGQQRIKVEFILSADEIPLSRVPGDQIFAAESTELYQVLPLNILFADKLTTLGPETIGIQDDRMDEQIKQIYDLYSLFSHHFEELEFKKIRQYYFKRAQAEAQDRNIFYDHNMIASDVQQQLNRLRLLDDGSENSKQHWKYVLDFISLYAGRSAIRTTGDWVVVGETLRLLFQILLETQFDQLIMKKALNIDKAMQFNHLSGQEKGQRIAAFREKFIEKYGHLTGIDAKILKGKKLSRIFWAVVTPDNLDELEDYVKLNG